ncbi:MAG TPA: hypothetical protein ENK02_00465 [Planctomycetes bacterium]|nr:hypothetical protein [Planctomycetota bacterium]
MHGTNHSPGISGEFQWVKPLLLLGAAGILYLGITQIIHYFHQTAEDAYILFRYAENLGDGYGIVSYPGGTTQEGASSLFLLLLLALGRTLDLSVPLLSKWIGVSSLLGSLGILWSWGRECAKGENSLSHAGLFLGVACLASLLLPVEIAVWSTAGLETLLTAFLFLFLAYSIWKAGEKDSLGGWTWTVALVAFIAANTRPEGLLYTLATFPLILLLRLSRGKRLLGSLLPLLPPLAILLLLEGSTLFLKFIYFGSIWSNPTFVKLSVRSWLNPGAYLLSFLQARGPIFWVSFSIQVAGFAYGLIRFLQGRLTSLTRAYLTAWVFVLLQLFVVFYTGGDYMALHRFLVPAFPTMAAATIFFSLELRSTYRPIALTLLPLALGGTGFLFHPLSWQASSGLLSQSHPPRAEKAVQKLRQKGHPDGPYAISECGFIPYHVPGPFIDLMGLNDKIIARSYKLYGVSGAPQAARDWVLSKLPWAIVAYDYWKKGKGIRLGEGVAWFFGCYFQSPFFKRHWDYERELPDKRNNELLFSYFKGEYQGTHDLRAEDPKGRDLLMHGFFVEPDKIWTSTMARVLLRPGSGHRTLHVEGWIPKLENYPDKKLRIEFYTQGFAIGSRLFGKSLVQKDGIFQASVPLPTNPRSKSNFLLTLRSSQKAHPKGSRDERALSWVFRRIWTTK